MSSALAAARKRRIPNEPVPPALPTYNQNLQQTSQNNTMPGKGLTLPQVIAIVDKRLIKLEEFMKQYSESETLPMDGSKISNDFNVMVDEFNERYSILAEEIESMKAVLNSTNNNVYDNTQNTNVNTILQELNIKYANLAQDIYSMKDMLLKLQSFTMEVNKTLVDERIRIFSDFENINTTLDIKKTLNFDKNENIQGFSQKLDYLEQTGEFNMDNEIINNE
jgi:uncharacterized small protein (DUF1192 family)